MFDRRSRLHAVALWLALGGVLLRGLVPAGFMPDFGATEGERGWLAICSAGELGAFAHGGRHAAEPAALADEHRGRTLADAHLGCPFAAAVGPALPAPAGAFAPAAGAGPGPLAAAPAAFVAAETHRQPQARAPPVLAG